MLFLCALKWTKLSWVIKYDWWPCLQACLHVVLVCTLVHCLHVEITHASTGARQVYDYFHKGFPCMWKPLLSSQWFICRVTSPQPVPIFTSRIGETLWSIQYLAQEQDALLQRWRPKLDCLMSNPVHNHSATMPSLLILMTGVGWIGSIWKAGTLVTLCNR